MSFLDICTCGCKVDLTCSEKYCIDYAVRENKEKLVPIGRLKELRKQFKEKELSEKFPKEHRIFKPNKYTRLNTWHKEKYLITRYQTICLDSLSLRVILDILNGCWEEKKLVNKFKNLAKEKEIRNFISKLIQIEALDLKN